jgi:hypothetical protein
MKMPALAFFVLSSVFKERAFPVGKFSVGTHVPEEELVPVAPGGAGRSVARSASLSG